MTGILSCEPEFIVFEFINAIKCALRINASQFNMHARLEEIEFFKPLGAKDLSVS